MHEQQEENEPFIPLSLDVTEGKKTLNQLQRSGTVWLCMTLGGFVLAALFALLRGFGEFFSIASFVSFLIFLIGLIMLIMNTIVTHTVSKLHGLPVNDPESYKIRKNKYAKTEMRDRLKS